jgi:hypothetical protein
MTGRMLKNEPRDAPQTIQPPGLLLDNASKRGVFREYEQALKDIMFLNNRLVTSTDTKMQDKVRSVTPDENMQTQPLTPAEMLRERLTHARNNKVLYDSRSLVSATSIKSSSDALMAERGWFPVLMQGGKARDIPTDPIPNKLPKGTSSKLKDSGLLWAYREARKNANKRKEASSSLKPAVGARHSASKGTSQQRQQGLPQPFTYLNFDLSPFTACVNPSLDAMVSSTSCMAMPHRSVFSTFPVDDPMDMDDMETTWPITSRVSHPASFTRQAAASEPMLAEKQRAMEEKTFRKIAKLKREVRRLQRKQVDGASTDGAPAAATAPTTPPSANVLASDSSLATPRSPMPEQESYSSETRREIHKIKRELRELRRISATNCDNESTSMLSQDSTMATVATTLAPIKKTKVRFSYPLVTQVNLRPYTLEADVEKLYFCPEELNELEWDRETTEADQYECIAQEQSSLSSATNVAIAHYEERGDDDGTVASDDQSFCSIDTDIISNAATE